MVKRTTYESENQITTDIVGLMKATGLGRANATKVATEAKAKIKVGRRSLYYLPKVTAYLESLTEKEVKTGTK